MASVLVMMECSGMVRRAFASAGHESWSVDLKQAEDMSDRHVVGDAFEVLDSRPWDLVIAHPSCQYLALSGARWLYRSKGVKDPVRWRAMEKGAETFRRCLDASASRVCVENPVMHGHARDLVGGTATQWVQPHQFGDDASKKTGLWLRGLPLLRGTMAVAPRLVEGRPRWANQTDSGQNALGPSAMRSTDRARTYPGIARAMADQWGPLL